ncbi:MAG: polyphosphate kinase 1 [Solirubrobacterales bacterium]|nr:polyphosphate kinase 1 [Solirubrobacterales bacterium]
MEEALTTENDPEAQNGTAVSVGEAPDADVAAAPDLEDTSLYFNRELSWLDFNERVLQLAEDTDVPLLERMRFCAIYEDNLDEFYMVRIAGMHDQVEANLDARGADAVSAREVIERVQERAVKLRKRLRECFEHDLRPGLAEHGIRILDLSEASASEHEDLDRLFKDQVFPALTPLVIGRGRPFPYISNLSLSLVVLLRNPEKDEEVVARVKVPKELLRRFLSVGDDDTTFVPIEQLIADNLEELFPGMEIVHHSLFRVTRDTDYDVSDEAADLLQAVEEEVRRRRFGEVVRLEVSSDMEPRLRDVLIDALKITDGQVYDIEGLIGLDDLNDIVDVPGHGDLRYAPWNRVTPPQLQQGQTQREVNVFEAIREGDILVHHPYDSYATSVERFVTQAVEDPNVLAIKETVYRTSSDSPLVTGLIEATERGKQAVCLVELKARFDESANIGWARSLEEAGVHVVYGIPGLKTHVKCVLVARREGEGVRNYVHIGTGNYNEKTARHYTDIGLFTANERIGEDIAEMFNYLTGYARPKEYDKVMVAPFTLRDGILEHIDRAIEAHSPESPARIRMKMNSLLDPTCIRALYKASQAGVDVQLNVRGICGLRPGVPGVSENIRVVSIVGRFLEHSRIYSFECGEEPSVWIGSADLMPRNLYKRVELVAPVEDETGRDQLSDVLDRTFADNTSSWELGSDGAWTRLEPRDGEEPRNLQDEMMRLHSSQAEAAASQVA